MRRIRSIEKTAAVCFMVALSAAGCRDSVSRLDRRDRSSDLVRKAEQEAREGRRENAIALYREALESDPGLAAVHLDCAMLLHDTGADYAGAIGHYRRYLELRPDSDKSAMISNRLNDAALRLASAIRASDPAAVKAAGEAVFRENETLREENRKLRVALSAVRAAADGAGQAAPQAAQGAVREQAGSEAPPAGQAAASGQAAPAGPRRYVVKSGDTLGGIAKEMYGNAAEWKKIHAANRETLSGPNLLVVGQVLVIP